MKGNAVLRLTSSLKNTIVYLGIISTHQKYHNMILLTSTADSSFSAGAAALSPPLASGFFEAAMSAKFNTSCVSGFSIRKIFLTRAGGGVAEVPVLAGRGDEGALP
jgi:hypothetical protein